MLFSNLQLTLVCEKNKRTRQASQANNQLNKKQIQNKTVLQRIYNLGEFIYSQCIHLT